MHYTVTPCVLRSVGPRGCNKSAVHDHYTDARGFTIVFPARLSLQVDFFYNYTAVISITSVSRDICFEVGCRAGTATTYRTARLTSGGRSKGEDVRKSSPCTSTHEAGNIVIDATTFLGYHEDISYRDCARRPRCIEDSFKIHHRIDSMRPYFSLHDVHASE